MSAGKLLFGLAVFLHSAQTGKDDIPSRKETHQQRENDHIDFFADLPPPSSAVEDRKGVKRKSEEVALQLQSKKRIQALYELQGFYAERKGEREEMQDAHIILDNYQKDIPHLHSSITHLSLYGVFDGHGGARAARFAASQLHINLANKFPKVDVTQVEKDIKKVLLDAFKKTDEDFLKEATKTKPSWKDGTTAIIILTLSNALYIANLGDSKAILCRFNKQTMKHVALPLSKDHAPTDYEERMRIQKAGGHVRDGRVMGVLEVSRSIGDGQYKALGVTCVPDIKRCQLTDDDCFVVLACDGIWKVFTSDQVIRIILNTLKDKNLKAVEPRTVEEVQYETACNRIVNEAIRKHSGDNVTVVIIAIRKRNQPN